MCGCGFLLLVCDRDRILVCHTRYVRAGTGRKLLLVCCACVLHVLRLLRVLRLYCVLPSPERRRKQHMCNGSMSLVFIGYILWMHYCRVYLSGYDQHNQVW